MEENSQTKKKNAGLTALIALLLIITAIASCLGIWAWAKYISSQQGNATAEIAKWSFDLKLKNGSAQETAGPIDLADTIDFTHIKEGTIAPGTQGQFQVIVNTSGTEVDCQYDVTIALSNCPRNITFTRVDENNVTTELSAGGASNDLTRTLTFSRYLKAKGTNGNENGRHVETITWNWPYEADVNETVPNKTAWDDRDNEDENELTSHNEVVTMNITATGTEMLENPNSVQGQVQAGNVHVGDSVNYNPGSATTESINLPEGASLGGTINASSAQNWVVLDVDEINGIVKIIPRTYSASTNLTLDEKNGYNNAIEAIDTVASIYKNNSYAEDSKGLTIEDVNKLENHTPNGSAAECTFTHRYGMNPTTLDITDAGEGNRISQTFTSTATTGSYYYTINALRTVMNNNQPRCWLASRCLSVGSSNCTFQVRILSGGQLTYTNLFGVTSKSVSDSRGSLRVVPVVSLKSNIQMTKDANNVWQLSL